MERLPGKTSQALRASSPGRGNNFDRRQWRKQEEIVGAAASRMQARAQQTLGAATRVRSTTGGPGSFVLATESLIGHKMPGLATEVSIR